MTQATTHVSAIRGLSGPEARRVAKTQMDRMLDLLRSLSDEEWHGPTDCEGWAVRDIAAHLLGWAEAVVSPTELARQFNAGRALAEEMHGLLHGINRYQVESKQHLSNRELLARIEVALPKMLQRRATLNRYFRYAPYWDGFLGYTNIGYVMNVIFTRDTFMHRADISRPAGKEMDLGEDDRRLLEDVVRDWAHRSEARMSLILTGPAGGRYLTAADPVAEATLDAVDFGRIMTRREPAEIADITGDREAALRWLSVFTPF